MSDPCVAFLSHILVNIEKDKGNKNFAKCCHANGYGHTCLVPCVVGVK